MTVSAETRAYWQELGGYYAAAERNGTDHTHPAKPPTADVAFDVIAICAESITLLMDDKKAGKFPTDSNADPSLESQLEASGIIDRQVQERGIRWGTGSSVRRGRPSRRSTNRPARQSCGPRPA